MPRRYSNAIGVDDGPFAREHRGDVPLLGAVTTRGRLDGVVRSKLRRDGANATTAIAAMLEDSGFAAHAQIAVLGGITFGGFNVVDIAELSERLGVPVLVVARRAPNLEGIRAALQKVRGGARKWKLIEQAGPMQACGPVFVQRAGLSLAAAERALGDLTIHGSLPEPIRLAHLLAGAWVEGRSRGRA